MHNNQGTLETITAQALLFSAAQNAANNDEPRAHYDQPAESQHQDQDAYDYTPSPGYKLFSHTSVPVNADFSKYGGQKPRLPGRMSVGALFRQPSGIGAASSTLPALAQRQKGIHSTEERDVLPATTPKAGKRGSKDQGRGQRASFVGRPRFSSAHTAVLKQDTSQFREGSSDKESDSEDEENNVASDSLSNINWEMGSKKPWYKRKKASRFLLLLFASVFIIAGGLYLAYGDDKMINDVQIWRLCFFIGGLPIIWLVGELATRLIVWGVEHTMFTVQNALYFAYAVRRPFANVLRAALALGWWALMMTAFNNGQSDVVAEAYDIILRIWACVTLFMLASLLKTLLAKILALKFNKQSHLRKIQDSLRKEYLLHLLLQPRVRSSEDAEGGGIGTDDSAVGIEGTDGNGTINQEESGMGGMTSSSGEPQHHLDRKSGKHRDRKGNGGGFTSSVKSWFTRGNNSKYDTNTTSAEELLEAGISSPVTSTDTPSSLTATEQQQQQQGKGMTPQLYPPSGSTVAIQVDAVGGQSGIKQHSGNAGAAAGGSSQHGANNTGGAHRARAGSSFLINGTASARPSYIEGVGNFNVSCQNSQNNRRRTSRIFDPTATGGGGCLGKEASSSNPFPRGIRAARLSTVVEAPVKKGKKKVLDMQQLAKMEAYIRKNALKSTFRDELSRVETNEETSSEIEAQKLAYYIFWNVKADLSHEYLIPSDFSDFVADEDVEAAFRLIDENGDGEVTLQECMETMSKLFRERRDLAVSLKDTKTVVRKLESVIGVCIHIIFFFIYMVVFDVDVMKTYLAMSSLILAFSFIFNNSIRTAYENVVFLFIVHPFDVGDMLQIDNETYRVDQIDLLYAIFLNSSGGRVWYPNQKLMSAPFINVTVSAEKTDSIKVTVDMDVAAIAMEYIKAAAEEVAASMPTEVIPSSVGVSVRETTAPLKYTIGVGWKYTHCGVEMGRCGTVKNAMHIAVAEALKNAGVRYTWPPCGWQAQIPSPLTITAAGGGDSTTAAAAGVDTVVGEVQGVLPSGVATAVGAFIDSSNAGGKEVNVGGVTWPPPSQDAQPSSSNKKTA